MGRGAHLDVQFVLGAVWGASAIFVIQTDALWAVALSGIVLLGSALWSERLRDRAL
jgi:uncharacterized membrane protein YoaK (UPF0700 family)